MPSHTVPGGWPSCSAGPATPVVDRPTSAPSSRRTPSAIAIAAASDDDRALGHVEEVELHLGGVGDDRRRGTTSLAPRDRRRAATATRPPVSDSATASVQPRASSRPTDDGLHRLVGAGEHERAEHGPHLGLLGVEQLVGLLGRAGPAR